MATFQRNEMPPFINTLKTTAFINAFWANFVYI